MKCGYVMRIIDGYKDNLILSMMEIPNYYVRYHEVSGSEWWGRMVIIRKKIIKKNVC